MKRHAPALQAIALDITVTEQNLAATKSEQLSTRLASLQQSAAVLEADANSTNSKIRVAPDGELTEARQHHEEDIS